MSFVLKFIYPTYKLKPIQFKTKTQKKKYTSRKWQSICSCGKTETCLKNVSYPVSKIPAPIYIMIIFTHYKMYKIYFKLLPSYQNVHSPAPTPFYPRTLPCIVLESGYQDLWYLLCHAFKKVFSKLL